MATKTTKSKAATGSADAGASARTYDVVLLGATGFTGRLTAEYLAERYGAGELRWAIAGRSASKLGEIVEALAAKYPSARRPDVLLADSHDRASLDALAKATRVVCTTVGPYAKYGTELVAACVAAGTDYCDLTGEVQFVRRMIDAHHAEAQKTGARIVHCCGFDSIPSDLGTWFLQQTAQERSGQACERATLYVKAAKGGFSGGTVASLLNVLEEARDPAVRRILGNPYALLPDGERSGPRIRGVFGVSKSSDVNAWTGPFLMESVNSRVVRRSNALLGYPWGREFVYTERTATGKGPAGLIAASALAAGLGTFVAVASVPPFRTLLQKTVLPAPGQGPTRAQIEKGFFVIEIVGHTASGDRHAVKVKGQQDPGYGATAAMLAESAVCLALDARGAGGVLTPATAMGGALIERLATSLVTFEVM